MSNKTMSEQTFPPRLIVDDNLDWVNTVEDLESENGITIPEKFHYMHFSEHQAREAELMREIKELKAENEKLKEYKFMYEALCK